MTHCYYVGVVRKDNSVRLVTDFNPVTAKVKYDAESTPQCFTPDVAEQLSDMLIAIGLTSFVVQSQYKINRQIGVC